MPREKQNKLFQEFDTYTQLGIIGESAVLNEFVRLGLQCYLPYGDLEKSDIVVSFKGTLKRIQIKSVYSVTDGYINVHITSRARTQNYKYNADEIDYIAIYSYELNQCFLVPIEEVEGLTQIKLRIDAPKNNNSVNIRWAKDYALSKVVSEILASMGI